MCQRSIYSLINPSSVLLFLLLLYVLPREGTAGQAHFVAASNGAEREDEPWSRRPIDKCQRFQGLAEASDSLCKGKVTNHHRPSKKVLLVATYLVE